MKRVELSLLAGLLVSLLLAPGAAFAADCARVRGEVLRLHILAASDSDADQRCKLAVRDALLEQSGSLFESCQSAAQAAAAAQSALPRLEQTARRALLARGCTDPVTARVTRLYFGTRRYGGVTLPAGEYQAVQLVTGSGRGHNWWCVMYPPLCLPAARPAAEATPAGRDIAELDSAPGYKMGFASVELLKSAGQLLRRLAGGT